MFKLDPKQAVADHLASGTPNRQAAALSPEAEEIVARPVEPTFSGPVIVGLAQAVEALLIATLGFVIYRNYVLGGDDGFYLPVILGSTLLANVLFNVARTHRIAAYRTVIKQLGRVLAAWSIVFVVLMVVAFAFKAQDDLSRVWLITWFVTGAVLLVLFRLGLRGLIRHWTIENRLKRRTVIVGGGAAAEALIDAIHQSADNDIALIGLFDDRQDSRSPDSVTGLPKLGKVADLIEFARRTRVDLVLVSMPLSAEKRVLDMLKQLWVLPVDIRLSAHMSTLRFTHKAYSYVGDLPVFDMADRPISDWNLVFKWVFDRLVAIAALIVFAPIMVATAIAIKLESKGPVFFKQKRHGFNNELIEVYKFRSMYTDMADANASRLVTKDDPRVTRVGRFIRKTSIDELPQLLNVVFKGDLSLVGPRPHAIHAKTSNRAYEQVVDGYFARHKVKPGITGWAQINGWRGETDTDEKIQRRVEHDLYYIENWSVLLDLYILLKTPFSLLTKNENAY